MKRPNAAKVHFGRFFRMLFPAVAILLVGTIVILGFFVYKVSYPEIAPEPVNPSHYLLPSLEIPISTEDGMQIPGWWIPGLKGAPGIILAPGYGMNRSDALSLGSTLHERGFNLLIYNQRGNGSYPKSASTLGLYEAGDMMSAVRILQSRPESNRNRVGIWGVDLGAYAALRAAAAFPEIKAVVADGAYASVQDFLNYRISEDFALENRIVQFGSLQIFRIVHVLGGSFSGKPFPYSALSDRMILFIKGENRKGLGDLTTAIYDRIQPQKEMISFRTARTHLMAGEDLRSYDRQVTNFFQLNLQ